MIKQERWRTRFLKTPSWQSVSEWFVPVLFRRGWNTLPAASHPLLKVLVLLKIYTWSFHGKIITGTNGWGWEGRLKKRAQHWLVIFRLRVWPLSLQFWLVKFLDGLPDPRERCVARSIGSSATWQNCRAVIPVQELPAFGHRIARWSCLNDHLLVGGNFASHNPSLEHWYWGQKLQGESARWYRFVACSFVLNSLDQLHLGGGNAAVGILQCWSVGHGTLDKNAGKSSMLNQRMMNDFICNM